MDSLTALIQSAELLRYKTALEVLENDVKLLPSQRHVVAKALYPERFMERGSVNTIS